MPHIHEKIDFTTDVYIVHKNKVLLRLHDKHKIWLGVGGHIELDEDANQAALREVKEEVGLDVKLVGSPRASVVDTDRYKELIPPKFLNIHQISSTHRHSSLIYFAKSTTDQVIPENPNDSWKWLTKKELEIMDIGPEVRFYAGRALEELGS